MADGKAGRGRAPPAAEVVLWISINSVLQDGERIRNMMALALIDS
jgi:hypothetical protein